MQEIPAAAYSFEMLPIAASADGAVKSFSLSRTEITWEAFDTFVYRLDEENGKPPPGGPDAVTRPSKPYLPPDRGFGHEGFAAIGMSYANAQAFCAWLSAHSGKKYRLPTEQEWEHACRGGSATDPGAVEPQALERLAWFGSNSNGSPHPAGSKPAGGFGLHDMLGNVREWCSSADGKAVTRGGGYNDPASLVTAAARIVPTPAWNASDPQIPKSKWWLADAPFVGFRVVCEVD